MMKYLWPLFAVSAVALPSDLHLHEVRESTYNTGRIVKRGPADGDASVRMRIGMLQRNIEKGYEHVMDVASPSSKNYAQYWTAGEVIDEFAPSEETVQEVQTWLKESGIHQSVQSSDKAWIAFDARLADVDKLLHAHFFEYEDRTQGTTHIGCEEYSLPRSISSIVDYVTPGVELSSPVAKVKRAVPQSEESVVRNFTQKPPHKPVYHGPYRPAPGSGALPKNLRNCSISITPDCIRALYDIPSPTSENQTIASGALGVFEADAELYNQTNLNKFFAKFAPYVPSGTKPHEIVVNGPVEYPYDGGEPDIDFDMSYGLLGPVNITLYQTQPPNNYNGSSTFFDPFLDAIDGSFCNKKERSGGFQCGGTPLTTVVSFSYGTPELFWQSRASQVRTCNEFMKYSLQGHTFVFSSGDYGVASNPGFGDPEFLCSTKGCISQDLKDPLAYNGTIFSPQFPANCPYVLAVGATQVLGNQTVEDPEYVMQVPGLGCGPGTTEFGSGGGFSNYFARPSYQNASVENYLAKYVPGYKYYEANDADASNNKTNIGKNGGVYNRPGRAYPDVSANGVNFTIFYENEFQNFYGTSLAAPLWASIITMLNAERASLGKAPVGLIQPALYDDPQVFHDITRGENPGCYTEGFPAVEGWDPSSGLGTPNYPALLSLFKSLS